jgi:hypothetical protein
MGIVSEKNNQKILRGGKMRKKCPKKQKTKQLQFAQEKK